MPSVMIWYPHSPDNEYGHAALHTDKYHISLWPHDPKQLSTLTGVAGEIVFAQEADKDLEGNRLPNVEHHLVNVTDSAINECYEEFLEFNDIDPSDVSLEKANELLDKWVALSVQDQVDINLHEMLSKKLSNTQYSFKGELDAPFYLKTPFFRFPQSCTSLCLNIIRRAINDPEPVYVKSFPVVRPVILNVLTFDTIVRQRYIRQEEDSSSSCTFL